MAIKQAILINPGDGSWHFRLLASRRAQSGLTLLEVMITVVILSLGLLGLAGLQMTGLKNNRNAYYQTVAAQVVQDLAERIKADQVGATTGNAYDNLFDDDAIDADATLCGTGIGEVAFDDRAACLVASLPGGQIRVREVSDGSNTFYVAARWTDLELGSNTGWSGAAAIAACGATDTDTARGANCYYNMITP